MNIINRATIYRNYHRDGLSLSQIADMYNVSVTTIRNSIHKLEIHEKWYAENEIYSALYDAGELIYGWTHNNGNVIRTSNALCRAGIKTADDVRENKERLLKGRIRDIGEHSLQLIDVAFFKHQLFTQ